MEAPHPVPYLCPQRWTPTLAEVDRMTQVVPSLGQEVLGHAKGRGVSAAATISLNLSGDRQIRDPRREPAVLSGNQ